VKLPDRSAKMAGKIGGLERSWGDGLGQPITEMAHETTVGVVGDFPV
jgi:hypothetical protein